MTYLLQFGSYVFPPGVAPMSQDSPKDLAEQERPRASGSITQTARQQSRKFVIEGALEGFGGGVTAIQATLDAMRAGIEAQGTVNQLYFGRSDRYFNAQCDGFTESYAVSGDSSWFGAAHKVSLKFTAGDPFAYAASATTVSGLAGGGTVTPGGNASALPSAWTITIGTGGAGTVTLTNSTTGESCPLTAPSGSFTSGDVIVLDRASYGATYNGVSTPGLLTGVIPGLAAGANTIAVATGSPVTVSTMTCQYTARWLG